MSTVHIVHIWNATMESPTNFILVCSNSNRLSDYRDLGSVTIIPLEDNADPNTLFSSDCYSANRDTVVYMHGILGNIYDNSGLLVKQAYLDRGETNVIGLDWSDEASFPVAGVLALPKAAVNAGVIGRKLGQFIVKLINAGNQLFSVRRLHLIGLSVGAHGMGSAGDEVKESANQTVARITGLDPFYLLFSSPPIINLRSLNENDAEFVDVYHTNPGTVGTNEALGTVDIWVNCVSSIQPGCENAQLANVVTLFPPAALCSHLLAPAVFAMAVRNGTAFVATSASDCATFTNGGEIGNTTNLGDDIDKTASGNYYINIDTSTNEYQTSAAAYEYSALQIRQLDLSQIGK